MTKAFIFNVGIALIVANGEIAFAQSGHLEIDKPPHNYRQRVPGDRFTKLKDDLESGRIVLDRSSEKAFVLSLLKLLEIPATSQMLVFSTTSLQLSLISPANPRAIYFSEDTYLGYVPRGRIEIISIDPELGGIFYIFDIPKDERPLRFERSERCMNCHAGEDTHFVPALVIKSVVPGPGGGSLTAFRQDQIGHGVPFDQRFGGWYVTGQNRITNQWGNLTGRLSPDGLAKYPVTPGERFNWDRYPVSTSDMLAQLLHEHQAGFANRAIEAGYRARTFLHENRDRLTAEQNLELDEDARRIARYLLFADEAPLPEGGLVGDSNFKIDFLSNRRMAANGTSLKDFDLRTRLFKYRCSYMIYSTLFLNLPNAVKQRVYENLRNALSLQSTNLDFAYLPENEKRAIHGILKETLSDLPKGW